MPEKFFFAHREGHDGNVGGGDALVGEFLVERHVGVAVEGRNHGGLCPRVKLFDFSNNGLPVGMAKGGVVDKGYLPFSRPLKSDSR